MAAVAGAATAFVLWLLLLRWDLSEVDAYGNPRGVTLIVPMGFRRVGSRRTP